MLGMANLSPSKNHESCNFFLSNVIGLMLSGFAVVMCVSQS